MSATALDELLLSLELAIKENKYYYDDILDNPAYLHLQPQIKVLRTKLFSEVKKQNENEVANLYSKFKLKQLFELSKSPQLPSNTKNMIQIIKSDLNLIDQRMKKNTYSDYRDNIELINDMKKRLEIIKNDLADFKKTCEISLSHSQNELQSKKRDLNQLSKSTLQERIFGCMLILLCVPGTILGIIVLLNIADIYKYGMIYRDTTSTFLYLCILCLSLTAIFVANDTATQNRGWIDFLLSNIIGFLILYLICFVILLFPIVIFWITSTIDVLILILSIYVPISLSRSLWAKFHHLDMKQKAEKDGLKSIKKQSDNLQLFIRNISQFIN